MIRLSDLVIAELTFVLKHNKSAIKAYEKFGFSESDYPAELAIGNCTYMIKR